MSFGGPNNSVVRDFVGGVRAREYWVENHKLRGGDIVNDSTKPGATVKDALNNIVSDNNSFLAVFQQGATGTLSLSAGQTTTVPGFIYVLAGQTITYSSGDWVMFDTGVPARLIAARSVSSRATALVNYVGQVILMFVGTQTSLPSITSTSRWDWVVGADYYHGTALADHTHANTSPGVATSFTPGFYEFDYTCQSGKNLGIAVEGTASSSTGRLWSKGSRYTTNASGTPASITTQTLLTGPRSVDLSAAYGLVYSNTTAVLTGDFINLDNIFYGSGSFSSALTFVITAT